MAESENDGGCFLFVLVVFATLLIAVMLHFFAWKIQELERHLATIEQRLNKLEGDL